MTNDEARGLYNKFYVERLWDTSGKHVDCEYFVLDLNHDEFAIAALRAYIIACEAKFPNLARDLRIKINKDT